MSCELGQGKVKPFPNGSNSIKPFPEDETFTMKPKDELPLHDSVASDSVKISGTTIFYYSLDVYGSSYDALYGEPNDRKFNGPFKIQGYVAWPRNQKVVTEFGSMDVFDSNAYLVRKDVEDAKMPLPSSGDVLGFWNIFFFDKQWGIDGILDQNAMFFFDVLNVNTDGHLYDSPYFVGFKLTIKRKTNFSPERRVSN